MTLDFNFHVKLFENYFSKHTFYIWYYRKINYLCTALEESTKGEMAEWSIAAVLKTVELRGSGGSNPSLSAGRLIIISYEIYARFYAHKC